MTKLFINTQGTFVAGNARRGFPADFIASSRPEAHREKLHTRAHAFSLFHSQVLSFAFDLGLAHSQALAFVLAYSLEHIYREVRCNTDLDRCSCSLLVPEGSAAGLLVGCECAAACCADGSAGCLALPNFNMFQSNT